jgi:amino acid transporter
MVRSTIKNLVDYLERLYNSVAGLFLGSGTSLAAAGPGGSVLAYVLMGTVLSSVISCLIEMTALMPVNAPVMEFPRRFLDRGVGFSIGWMYWYALPEVPTRYHLTTWRFAYGVLASEELVAVAAAINFKYDDGTTSLYWGVGNTVNPVIWIALFLIIATIINMAPVKVYPNWPMEAGVSTRSELSILTCEF